MHTNTQARGRVAHLREAPVVATLRLRTDQLAKIRRWKGVATDSDLAARMGIDAGSVSRVLRGTQQPGPKFVASLCLALDASLDDLFEAVPGDERTGQVA